MPDGTQLTEQSPVWQVVIQGPIQAAASGLNDLLSELDRIVELPDIDITPGGGSDPVDPPTEETALASNRRQVGKKQYEFTDHLGNVSATISDRRLNYGLLDSSEVLSANTYWPFGMQLSTFNRVDTIGYRYGFNGMEQDPELYGEGNAYTTEFRQLDTRLSRWWSIDPMVAQLPWQSPYNSMDNNPVMLNDPNGDIANNPCHNCPQERANEFENELSKSNPLYVLTPSNSTLNKFEKAFDLLENSFNIDPGFSNEVKMGTGIKFESPAVKFNIDVALAQLSVKPSKELPVNIQGDILKVSFSTDKSVFSRTVASGIIAYDNQGNYKGKPEYWKTSDPKFSNRGFDLSVSDDSSLKLSLKYSALRLNLMYDPVKHEQGTSLFFEAATDYINEVSDKLSKGFSF